MGLEFVDVAGQRLHFAQLRPNDAVSRLILVPIVTVAAARILDPPTIVLTAKRSVDA